MRIRQRTAGYVSLRKHISACLLLLEVVLVLGELIRQHTSAYVSIRQHTPAAYVSIPAAGGGAGAGRADVAVAAAAGDAFPHSKTHLY